MYVCKFICKYSLIKAYRCIFGFGAPALKCLTCLGLNLKYWTSPDLNSMRWLGLFTNETFRKHLKLILIHKDFITCIVSLAKFSSAFFHPHFSIRIFPSAFFHPHFLIRIFPSTFYHPQFSIRILSSAFFYPPYAIRHPLPETRSNQSPLIISRCRLHQQLMWVLCNPSLAWKDYIPGSNRRFDWWNLLNSSKIQQSIEQRYIHLSIFITPTNQINYQINKVMNKQSSEPIRTPSKSL